MEQNARKIFATKTIQVNMLYISGGMLTAAPVDLMVTTDKPDELDSLLETYRATMVGTVVAHEDEDIEFFAEGTIDTEHEVMHEVPLLRIKRSSNMMRKDCILCSFGEHLTDKEAGTTVIIEGAAGHEDPDLIEIPAIFINCEGKNFSIYSRILSTDININLHTCSKFMFIRGNKSEAISEYHYKDATVVYLPKEMTDIEALSMYIIEQGFVDNVLVKVDPYRD